MLSAYWLAHHYHQSPETFLAMTPGAIFAHVAETHRMLKAIEKAGED